jgi:hypothetical protein
MVPDLQVKPNASNKSTLYYQLQFLKEKLPFIVIKVSSSSLKVFFVPVRHYFHSDCPNPSE